MCSIKIDHLKVQMEKCRPKIEVGRILILYGLFREASLKDLKRSFLERIPFHPLLFAFFKIPSFLLLPAHSSFLILCERRKGSILLEAFTFYCYDIIFTANFQPN